MIVEYAQYFMPAKKQTSIRGYLTKIDIFEEWCKQKIQLCFSMATIQKSVFNIPLLHNDVGYH